MRSSDPAILAPDGGVPPDGGFDFTPALVDVLPLVGAELTAGTPYPWDFASRCDAFGRASCTPTIQLIGDNAGVDVPGLIVFEGLFATDGVPGVFDGSRCLYPATSNATGTVVTPVCFDAPSTGARGQLGFAARGAVGTLVVPTGVAATIGLLEVPLNGRAEGDRTLASIPPVGLLVRTSSRCRCTAHAARCSATRPLER